SARDNKILYVSGEVVSYPLDRELISEGYNVVRLINYSVKHNENLDLSFLESLKKNIPDLVYVYSENSAKSFLNLIKKYELVDYWMNTNLMCIGEKTSSVLNVIKWKKIFLFNPGEEEFLLYKI
ncbi:uroporphyrinogen-III synthase, partial [Candidatus Pelagibacter sp.]|nr:uroporphyrinogen-III synthase [Candidatus Pelagibacter sp.]